MANDLAMVRQLERFVRLRELHRGKAMTDMVKVFGRRPTKRWCGTRPAYGNRPCTNPRGAGGAMGIWRICCSGGGRGTAAAVGAATAMRRRMAASDGETGLWACHRPAVIALDGPIWRLCVRSAIR